jgi:predicted phosphodiesterase
MFLEQSDRRVKGNEDFPIILERREPREKILTPKTKETLHVHGHSFNPSYFLKATTNLLEFYC